MKEGDGKGEKDIENVCYKRKRRIVGRTLSEAKAAKSYRPMNTLFQVVDEPDPALLPPPAEPPAAAGADPAAAVQAPNNNLNDLYKQLRAGMTEDKNEILQKLDEIRSQPPRASGSSQNLSKTMMNTLPSTPQKDEYTRIAEEITTKKA